MYIKKVSILLFIIPLFTLSLLGCGNLQGNDNTPTNNTLVLSETPIISSTPSSVSPSITSSAPLIPIEFKASFPDGAPPLNHETELRCTVKTTYKTAQDISLTVILPEAFELVSGELSWTGDVPKNSEVSVIRAVVRSVKTGNWEIKIKSFIDPAKHGYGGSGVFSIYASISGDTAQWGIFPPWNTYTPGAPAPITPAGGNTTNPIPPSSSEGNILNSGE